MSSWQWAGAVPRPIVGAGSEGQLRLQVAVSRSVVLPRNFLVCPGERSFLWRPGFAHLSSQDSGLSDRYRVLCRVLSQESGTQPT